ncbi:hypothetical protein [Vibrio sp. 16]|uniref:hypothetical protein n=1 Tax=Vibrio sp. 16 TaxID=391586 RepID=UPI00018F3842|nr:hypothetical protein [Vibrio sp. 16]EED28138.1 hypothetical protein VPMS16_3088 [Vibrio sp. 16]CAK4075330.1 hypothetical protein VDT1_3936 [Vibrio sp. 16]
MLIRVSLLLLLSFSSLSWANSQTSPLFLYSLNNPVEEDLHQPEKSYSDEILAKDETLPIEYRQPCDVKCGVRNTSLFVLQMVAEAKADQEYRTRLILPNDQP